MSDRKKKLKRKIPVEGLGGLMKLASELFPEQLPSPPDPAGVRELELKLKIKRSGPELKLELKAAKPARKARKAPAEKPQAGKGRKDAEDKKAYRLLKKDLQKNFNLIEKELARKKLPAKSAVAEFLQQCRALTQFAGKAEEFYPDLLAACDAFEQAFAAGNVSDVRQAFDEIAARKKSCHRQRK